MSRYARQLRSLVGLRRGRSRVPEISTPGTSHALSPAAGEWMGSVHERLSGAHRRHSLAHDRRADAHNILDVIACIASPHEVSRDAGTVALPTNPHDPRPLQALRLALGAARRGILGAGRRNSG